MLKVSTIIGHSTENFEISLTGVQNLTYLSPKFDLLESVPLVKELVLGVGALYLQGGGVATTNDAIP